MKIHVDHQTCHQARECRLCLDRCPEKVFGAYPQKPRQPGVAASDWTVAAMYPSECTNCRECLTFCPRHAISLQ